MTKSIVDRIEVDSAIERAFAQGLEARDDIRLFLKLPRWFTVATPLGKYNPDWAIVKRESTTVYLVSETKGSVAKLDLRGSEWAKIECGRAHFAQLDVQFRTATSPDDI